MKLKGGRGFKEVVAHSCMGSFVEKARGQTVQDVAGVCGAGWCWSSMGATRRTVDAFKVACAMKAPTGALEQGMHEQITRWPCYQTRCAGCLCHFVLPTKQQEGMLVCFKNRPLSTCTAAARCCAQNPHTWGSVQLGKTLDRLQTCQ